MKKILALVLAALIVFGMLTFTGCGKKLDDDKGAVIQMYLSALPANLRPNRFTIMRTMPSCPACYMRAYIPSTARAISKRLLRMKSNTMLTRATTP